MSLPYVLTKVPEDTTVVGDVDALIEHIESGKAYEGFIRLREDSIKFLIDLDMGACTRVPTESYFEE
jgi:hypothetical protein